MFIDIKHGHTEPVEAGEDFDKDSKTPFKYLVDVGPDGQLPADDPKKVVDALDALADAMVDETPETGDDEASFGPIFTYWSQFLDHELTARTDRTTKVSDITLDAAELEPVPRKEVERDLLNRRTPAIELDSVYGDGLPGHHGIKTQLSTVRSFRLAGALRDGAKLRVGTAVVVEGPNGLPVGALPPPGNDLARDLPRIGQLLKLGVVRKEDFSKDLRDLPTFEKRAFIGDPRNDENLIVAQFHVAMLRFHNAVVDWLSHKELRDDHFPGRNDLFEDARRIVRWTHQWLVVNQFMKTLLQDDVVEAVHQSRARKYFARADDNEPYMPVEFSVACYRFGHSLIRGAYDFNRNFGNKADAAGEKGFVLEDATLDLLFRFTGKNSNPLAGQESLPHNWIIEWRRFDGSSPTEGRKARKLNTHLDKPLKRLTNEGDPDPDPDTESSLSKLQKHLAKRNLRRGYHLSLPTGQALATALDIKPMSPDEIKQGTSDKLRELLQTSGFDKKTPLWYYTLKEAEIGPDKGNKLGTLGSRVVAETLFGVLFADPESYLVKNPRWNPSKPILGTGGPLRLADGRTIQTISDLLEFAGVKPAK